MDEEKYHRQKQRKLDKHYSIIINGSKVKILNYKVGEYYDHITNEKTSTIEFITKISNDIFHCKRIECIISKDNNEIILSGSFRGAFLGVSLFRYIFEVEKFYQKQD